jgi:hypothetical protein
MGALKHSDVMLRISRLGDGAVGRLEDECVSRSRVAHAGRRVYYRGELFVATEMDFVSGQKCLVTAFIGC